MKLQVLVAALNQDVKKLPEKMNLKSDAIIVNQTDHFAYEEIEKEIRAESSQVKNKTYKIKCFSFNERGVGLSRNTALLRADGDICLFSDEDIVYEEDYEKKILDAFEKYPQADMLLFNIKVAASRATYHIERFHRVHVWNSGKFPLVSFAAKTKKLHQKNITFSLLFGGGAPYSNGEDSLFLMECLQKGLKVFAVPENLGSETERESTWFSGYHEKFFIDKGVLFHYLYGKLAIVMAIRFVFVHGHRICQKISRIEAIRLMNQGIKSQK